MDAHQQTVQTLKQDWNLQLPDTITEEELIRLLAERLAAFLDKGPEAFFQLMYRLDIPEQKLTAVIQGKDPVTDIARLIYQRQMQKALSRAFYKKDNNIDNDPELSW